MIEQDWKEEYEGLRAMGSQTLSPYAVELIDFLITQAECDCVRVEISSRACRNCGKIATIPNAHAQSLFVELTQLDYKLGKLLEEYRNDVGVPLDKIEQARKEAAQVAQDHRARLENR